jgi:hypothetical protein
MPVLLNKWCFVHHFPRDMIRTGNLVTESQLDIDVLQIISHLSKIQNYTVLVA